VHDHSAGDDDTHAALHRLMRPRAGVKGHADSATNQYRGPVRAERQPMQIRAGNRSHMVCLE
jgi:hypothetical protein